jgi:SAM-dependent methyltransferase
MHCIQESYGSHLIPKLLGSYECELHNAIYEVISTQPRVVVNIGCAEGYYAIGFARLLPDAVVYAYDINKTAREYCTELVKLNGLTGRVIVREKCDKSELESLPLEGAVIISDCEGYELDLLDPGKVPGLSKAILIVELHDCLVPGLSDELLPRFEDTHNILLVSPKQRTPGCYQSLAGFKPAEQQLALNEGRQIIDKPVQGQWAYMVSKTSRAKP